jgi:hypothetical protein
MRGFQVNHTLASARALVVKFLEQGAALQVSTKSRKRITHIVDVHTHTNTCARFRMCAASHGVHVFCDSCMCAHGKVNVSAALREQLIADLRDMWKKTMGKGSVLCARAFRLSHGPSVID